MRLDQMPRAVNGYGFDVIETKDTQNQSGGSYTISHM